MKTRNRFDVRHLLKILAAATGIFLSVYFSEECARGIQGGILYCIEALVPSLFLFMTAASYTVKSGAAEVLARPLDSVSKRLFRLPYPALSVILLAMIGGYPVGARCAAMLYEDGRLSAKQAAKTACIAVCAGPGFLLNFVGRALLGNADAGTLLLIAESIGTLLTGILTARMIPCDVCAPQGKKRAQGENLLVASVLDASRATFHMCGMVLICSAVIEIIGAVSPYRIVSDLASAAVEITTGCAILCRRYPLFTVAFFIGFGGLSVHLQIFAGVGTLPLKKRLFFFFRIIQGIITAALTYILLMIFPIEVSVFNSTASTITVASSSTLVGSAALVISSLCFLGSIHHTQSGGKLCAE